MTNRHWFAVRSIFRHTNSDLRATFEERISLYMAATVEDAFTLAARDSQNYVSMNEGFLQIKHVDVFQLGHGDSSLHGREV